MLVVEDDLDTVHSMAMLVKMMGHECQFAINGLAALDIARRFQPHIVDLDIGLPDQRPRDRTAAKVGAWSRKRLS
jgi:DNA-binding response OmpR family regulator